MGKPELVDGGTFSGLPAAIFCTVGGRLLLLSSSSSKVISFGRASSSLRLKDRNEINFI